MKTTKNKEQINIVEPAVKAFEVEMTSHLTYLKTYFDSRYSPLKAMFSVTRLEKQPYIEVRFSLIGEKYWGVHTHLNIENKFNMMIDHSHLVQKYVEELKNRTEEQVIQEGIKSINR